MINNKKDQNRRNMDNQWWIGDFLLITSFVLFVVPGTGQHMKRTDGVVVVHLIWHFVSLLLGENYS